jgi:hypothetical protein
LTGNACVDAVGASNFLVIKAGGDWHLSLAKPAKKRVKAE